MNYSWLLNLFVEYKEYGFYHSIQKMYVDSDNKKISIRKLQTIRSFEFYHKIGEFSAKGQKFIRTPNELQNLIRFNFVNYSSLSLLSIPIKNDFKTQFDYNAIIDSTVKDFDRKLKQRILLNDPYNLKFDLKFKTQKKNWGKAKKKGIVSIIPNHSNIVEIVYDLKSMLIDNTDHPDSKMALKINLKRFSLEIFILRPSSKNKTWIKDTLIQEFNYFADQLELEKNKIKVFERN